MCIPEAKEWNDRRVMNASSAIFPPSLLLDSQSSVLPPKVLLSFYALSGTILGRYLRENILEKGPLFFLGTHALILMSRALLNVCAAFLGWIMDSWRLSIFWPKRNFGEPYLTDKETYVCAVLLPVPTPPLPPIMMMMMMLMMISDSIYKASGSRFGVRSLFHHSLLRKVSSFWGKYSSSEVYTIRLYHLVVLFCEAIYRLHSLITERFSTWSLSFLMLEHL